MANAYLLGASVAVILCMVIVLAVVVPKIRSARRRKALERILEKYHRSGQALLKYVMLNRRCSEETAYQRLALFVKAHVPLDDQSYIDSMLVRDRQSLLDSARHILVYAPDEIDKI